MRGAVCGWVLQAVALVSLERSAFSLSWLLASMIFAAWAMHAAIEMAKEATVACGVMAMGCCVWHVRHDVSMPLTMAMAGAFMMPLVWRAWRIPS